MSKMPYVMVYADLESTVNLLSDTEAGRLLKSLLAYVNDEEATVSGPEKLVYQMLKNQIDRDAEKYQSRAETNRENGRKGGAPAGNQNARKTTENNPEQPRTTENNRNQAKTTLYKEKEEDKEKDKDEEEDKTKTKKKTVGASPRFTPPTVDEVRDYCDERHNAVNAERFVDFYESKGWRVGSQPMKDWRAAVRTWENRDERPGQAEKPKKSSNPFFDMLKAEQAKRAVEVEPEIERW